MASARKAPSSAGSSPDARERAVSIATLGVALHESPPASNVTLAPGRRRSAVMRTIPVTGASDASPRAVARARTAVDRLATLADVLAWGRAQSPPAAVLEIVTQDEYTHDVVLPFGDHFLVFDAT